MRPLLQIRVCDLQYKAFTVAVSSSGNSTRLGVGTSGVLYTHHQEPPDGALPSPSGGDFQGCYIVVRVSDTAFRTNALGPPLSASAARYRPWWNEVFVFPLDSLRREEMAPQGPHSRGGEGLGGVSAGWPASSAGCGVLASPPPAVLGRQSDQAPVLEVELWRSKRYVEECLGSCAVPIPVSPNGESDVVDKVYPLQHGPGCQIAVRLRLKAVGVLPRPISNAVGYANTPYSSTSGVLPFSAMDTNYGTTYGRATRDGEVLASVASPSPPVFTSHHGVLPLPATPGATLPGNFRSASSVY